MHNKHIALPGLLALVLTFTTFFTPNSSLARQISESGSKTLKSNSIQLVSATPKTGVRNATAKPVDSGNKFLVATGKASYYASDFHGKRTANGETFNMKEFTAAHPSLPFGTVVRVTNLNNGKMVFVTINDRGPYIKNRIIDLSKAAAKQLDLVDAGVGRVKIEAYN